MPPAFDDVPSGEALAVVGRYDRRAKQRQPHLASVSVASQRKGHTRRYLRKDVGIVGDGDDRAAVPHRREGVPDVMPRGPEIADPHHPHAAGCGQDGHGGVLEITDPDPGQGG